MSLLGTLDIAIHLGTFRGIELTASGLYRIRVVVTQEGDPLEPVCPYDISKSPAPPRGRDVQSWMPGEIQAEENAYVSSGFVVKFRDEFVLLNEIVHFRTDLQVGDVFEKGALIFTFTLEAFTSKEMSLIDDIAGFVRAFPPDLRVFKPLSTETLRVTSPGMGKHEFFPVFFSEWNCSVTTILVHTSLFRFTFRPVKSAGEEMDFYNQIATVMLDRMENLASEDTQHVYNEYVSAVLRSHDQLLVLCRRFLSIVTRYGGKALGIELPERTFAKGKLVERLPQVCLESIGKLFIADISEIAGPILQLKSHLLALELQYHAVSFEFYKKQYRVLMTDHCGESVFPESRKVIESPTRPSDENIGKRHDKIATKQRGSEFFRQLTQLPIQSLKDFSDTRIHPILFHEQYYTEVISKGCLKASPTRGFHVFILVHGFMGNLYDMKTIKDEICAVYPDAVVVSTDSVQGGGMDTNISDMGEKLAAAVKEIIKTHEISQTVGRISFIGHSLGGIVIRAALQYLEELKPRLFTYISLASPHLGYLASKSKMVNAGLWFIKKWKRSKCLRQLSLTDEASYPEAMLFRLAAHPGLQWFQHVVLVSSYQDEFVPYESARVEVHPGLSKNPLKQSTLDVMARSIISGIRPECLHRLDVNYLIQGKSIDKMIGRRAHIQQIENSAVIRLMVYCFPGLFGQGGDRE